MQKKIILQVVLFLIALLISLITYFSYFNKENNSINNEMTILNQTSENDEKSNIIKDLYYISSDNNQNFYEIKSDTGELDPNNKAIIFMVNVKAKIYTLKTDPINITSTFATYNNETYETTFSEDVKITYMGHTITSQTMNLSTEKKLATLYKDVIYTSLGVELKADTIEIDLITRNSKIFMDNKNKKVLVTGKN